MAELLPTNKKRPCRVVDGGYTMLVHTYSVDGNVVRWRCSQYKSCPARGTSISLQGAFTYTCGASPSKEHNHVADPVKTEVGRAIKTPPRHDVK